ncbi:hypothetical protein Daus18300_000505 [Diaporthe australafricana]|uniref:Uncharacterized protein n=1 Tax=Diaporthe australafricana TaxID=127596 RepID=A0ABR3Y4Z0_9PEZI
MKQTENHTAYTVQGHKVYRLGSGWFDEDHLKNGEGPVFPHVLFEEGHILRNHRSSCHIAAALLPKTSQVLYTGTPI